MTVNGVSTIFVLSVRIEMNAVWNQDRRKKYNPSGNFTNLSTQIEWKYRSQTKSRDEEKKNRKNVIHCRSLVRLVVRVVLENCNCRSVTCFGWCITTIDIVHTRKFSYCKLYLFPINMLSIYVCAAYNETSVWCSVFELELSAKSDLVFLRNSSNL